MTWSIAFRLRRYLRESLWVVPLVGGALGWTLEPVSAEVTAAADLASRWQYSASSSSGSTSRWRGAGTTRWIAI